MTLVEQLLLLTGALRDGGVPYAIGGAIALAYCVEEPRATIDIDCNVFVDGTDHARVLAALPNGVAWSDRDVAAIVADGQVRLWWEQTPVDLFFNTTPFHREVALRAVAQPFAGAHVHVLACQDLAVFKAFFDRTKDWADLEAMAAAGVLDVAAVSGVLASHLGLDDPRVRRVLELGTADR